MIIDQPTATIDYETLKTKKNVSTKDKLLFLDIDGVLNSHQSAYYHRRFIKRDEKNLERMKYKEWMAHEFCPMAVGQLHRIVSETKCKIVVSSTWRLGQSLEAMKEWFKDAPLIADAIIGKTLRLGVRGEKESSYSHVPRGTEIEIWLQDNGYGYADRNIFVIVDDDADMWPHHKNFFQTDGEVGLNYFKAQEMIDFLNKDDE